MALNATLMETLDRIIEEDFGNTIISASKDVDEVTKDIIDNSMGVTRDGLGRGWQKIQVFKTGLAGAASWRGVSGNPPMAGSLGAANQFIVWNTTTPQSFPAITEATSPAYVPIATQLKEMYGIFHVPVEIMRLDEAPTNIGNQYEAILEGTVRRLVLRECLAFWGESNSTTGGDTSIGAYASGTAPAGNVVIQDDGTFDITNAALGGVIGVLSRYEILKLQEGECVDVFERNAGDTAWVRLTTDTTPVFVAATDDIGLAIALTFYAGGGDITLTAGRLFELHPFKSSAVSGDNIITNQPNPLASWIKSSGTLFGGHAGANSISLASYPWFKSTVKALSGGETTPSEQVFNRYVGGFLTAKNAATRPDTMITTPGVKSKHVNNLEYTGRRERHVLPIQLSEGYKKEWDYQRDGYQMMIKTSNYCPEGTLYAIKMRDGNIQKIVPPSPPGVGRDERFGGSVEFLAKITGPSIFTATRAPTTAAFTDFLEAPFKRWVQFFPEYIPGVKLTGLDEDIATT